MSVAVTYKTIQELCELVKPWPYGIKVGEDHVELLAPFFMNRTHHTDMVKVLEFVYTDITVTRDPSPEHYNSYTCLYQGTRFVVSFSSDGSGYIPLDPDNPF